MEVKIIRSEDGEKKIYGDTHVTDIINHFDWPFFSIAKIEKMGDDVKSGYDTESHIAYYVLEGEGKCEINGAQYFVKKGDCLIYPQGTTYKHLHGLTLLAIASPRFERGKRIYTE